MSPSNRIKTLNIDGRDLSAREYQTIMSVARENDIFIPTLCHMEGLTPIGSCRLCLVEIVGSPKLVPACVTEIQEGMQVVTQSERLTQYRRLLLEMLFVARNHICSICVSNGHCELQALAQKLGMDHIHLPYRYPSLTVDLSHDRFGMDHNRCIRCARCIRVCDEIEGAHTWDFRGRGDGSKIVCDLNQPWGSSETCTSCGKCVHVCPTGALFDKGKSSAEMSKRQEFLPYLTLMRGEHDD